MIVNKNNYHEINTAKGCVLLLYYELLCENGFTNDQEFQIDTKDFDGYRFLDVTIDIDEYFLESEINIIQEGSVIYLLSRLETAMGNDYEHYLNQMEVQEIIAAYQEGKLSAIPEVKNIFDLINNQDTDFDYQKYKLVLDGIYQKYVVELYKSLVKI